MHTFEDQARREGIEINFTELLANCVFVGNAMTHVGGVTPYQVVMGRQPACLPPITDNPGIEERLDSRIREIALQSMISATSATRITRALDTQTTVSGVGRFTPGDMVELYRKPMNQDISGWSGPHEVVDCKAEDGVVTLKNPRTGKTIQNPRCQTCSLRLCVLDRSHKPRCNLKRC